ncbi:helix-turn-helix domain-containing protein [Pedobacter steynii]
MYLEREMETPALSRFSANDLPSDLRFVQELEKVLERHYKSQKRLEFYSDCLGVSFRRLNAICLSHLGKTLHEMIQERRFNESLKLLKFTTLSVKEISYYLGFSDPPYFIRVFKKQTGVTPRAYRKYLVSST